MRGGFAAPPAEPGTEKALTVRGLAGAWRAGGGWMDGQMDTSGEGQVKDHTCGLQATVFQNRPAGSRFLRSCQPAAC